MPKDLNLIASGSAAIEVYATLISTALTPSLGVTPELGRGFSQGEDSQSVLLSHQLWKSRLGGDPAIVGRPIRLGDQEFSVVGVMPTDFQFPESTDLWLPPGPLMGDELTNPVRHSLGFVARLRAGKTQQEAQARVETIFRRLATANPKTSSGFAIEISGLQEDLTAKSRPILSILSGAVALALLIACGNVANLLLSRAGSRTREIAIRTALGAGVSRIVRQLITESLVLAALGGAAGLLLAAWSLAAVSPIPAPVDSTVLLFLLVVSGAAGLAFGLAPALDARKTDPIAAIKSGSGGASHSAVFPGTVVILEFAFTLVVVAGAGILAKSFFRLMHVDPGFNPHGVLTLRLSSPPSQDANALFARIEERLKPLPGVQSIAAANTLPIIATRANALRFNVPGSPLINPDALPMAQIRAVSPDYFFTMRIPLRSGRSFTKRDLGQPVVIINETMASRFWPGKNPVGSKFVTGP